MQALVFQFSQPVALAMQLLSVHLVDGTGRCLHVTRLSLLTDQHRLNDG